MRRRKGKTSDTAAIRRSTAKTMRSASSTRPGTTTIMSTTLAPYARKARQLSRHATRMKKGGAAPSDHAQETDPRHATRAGCWGGRRHKRRGPRKGQKKGPGGAPVACQ